MLPICDARRITLKYEVIATSALLSLICGCNSPPNSTSETNTFRSNATTSTPTQISQIPPISPSPSPTAASIIYSRFRKSKFIILNIRDEKTGQERSAPLLIEYEDAKQLIEMIDMEIASNIAKNDLNNLKSLEKNALEPIQISLESLLEKANLPVKQPQELKVDLSREKSQNIVISLFRDLIYTKRLEVQQALQQIQPIK